MVTGPPRERTLSRPALGIDQIPLPVVLVDATGTIVLANDMARQLPSLQGRLPESWLQRGPLADALSQGTSTAGRPPLSTGMGPVELTCTPMGPGEEVCVVLRRADDHTALAARLRFVEEVLALAGVGGWELDLATMTPLWTDEVCHIHEVPVGHVPTLDEAIRYYAPEARPIVEAAVARSIEDGRTWDLDLPLITATGRRIQVRAQGRPIFEGGRCVRLLGSFQDITEQHRARTRIQATLAEARGYEALFRDANALLAFANFDGHFTRLNHAWTALLGWTTEELMARPFVDFVHPDDRERTIQEAGALARPGHQTVGFRNRYRTRDGAWVSLEWVATSDVENDLIHAVAHNVTRSIARSRELGRLAMIAARTTNAVLITNEAGEIEWINHSFTKITGFSAEEAIGSRPGDLLQGPRTDPATVAFMRGRIRQRQPFEAEVVNHRKDGTPYWIAIEAKPLTDDSGAFIGYMAVEADVTARKQAETALIDARDHAQQLAREARAAADAKSGFLAMMSHELRTPMNGILGTAQLLADTELDPGQSRLLDTLQQAGQGLLSLLNDILDYSKFESGAFEMDCAPFHLPGLMQACAALFRAVASERALEFRVELHPDLPATVLGDELRLRQVVVNLLGNAFKFTDSGRVVLSAAPGPNQDGVRIEILDTGIGIPEDKQELLFRPFSQVDASTSRRFGGTGLGLAICHRIVQLMDGQIGLHSEAGTGSRFWVDLPLSQTLPVDDEPLATRPAGPPLGHPASVLLVEDNPINTLVATRMLERFGCRVVQANDGLEALAAVRREPFDLVLMDCHMPRMDGFAATREIRRREREEPARRLPIVAHTASCMPDEVARCEAAGMDDLLPKPVEMARLQQVLERWVQE